VEITSEAMIVSLYSVQYTEYLNGRSATYAVRSYVTIPLTGWHGVA